MRRKVKCLNFPERKYVNKFSGKIHLNNFPERHIQINLLKEHINKLSGTKKLSVKTIELSGKYKNLLENT